MIGTIRRHQQWLWIVVIVATIISFTAYLSPSARNGMGLGSSHSGGGELGMLNGEPITPEQNAMAEREGALFYRLHYGQWASTSEQKKIVDNWAKQRLFLDAEMKQLNINVTPEAAARFTKQMLGLRPDQTMPKDKFDDFIHNELELKGGLTLDDFNRFVVHQAGQEYLVALFGMSGKLITSQEAEFFYRRENAPMLTELVNFPVSNYYAFTKPNQQELEDYYSKHQADYRLPDRIQVNYITFAGSNFAAQADKTLGTNLDDRADQVYHQQGPEVFKDEAGKQLTQEQAEAKIKVEIRIYAELGEARKAANAFLNELTANHDDEHPYTTEDLWNLAKTNNLKVLTSEPFDEKDGSKEIDVSAKSLHGLFSLRADDPDDKERSLIYAPSPLFNESNVYVIGLQKSIPSQMQPLDQVHDEVVKDYRESTSLMLARGAGEKFANALQAGLAQGQSFDSVCASENVKAE
ncbi:MAG TPA: SurA N-terminal domain-containing protein, partial [Verrucomicrobiae bacterium]|nr:SurA N-terminal domain-containing protein [Verrucomicrobiae bacterium]